jgi:hypothetical protein
MLGRRFCFRLLVQFERGDSPVSQPSGGTGFTAFIPQQIDPSWHAEWGPKLAGFPLNLVYARARNSNAGPSLEPVIYWPDLDTYRADSDHREICYFTKHPNGYRVRVIHHTDSGKWRTEKFRGDILICSAAGATFDKVMIQTTIVSAEADE